MSQEVCVVLSEPTANNHAILLSGLKDAIPGGTLIRRYLTHEQALTPWASSMTLTVSDWHSLSRFHLLFDEGGLPSPSSLALFMLSIWTSSALEASSLDL